jgi:hypothetical protein
MFSFNKRKSVLKEKSGIFLIPVFTKGKKVVGQALFSKERL